jgi:hypothetical protein
MNCKWAQVLANALNGFSRRKKKERIWVLTEMNFKSGSVQVCIRTVQTCTDEVEADSEKKIILDRKGKWDSNEAV